MEVQKSPINIWFMDVDKFVKQNFIKEVTSLLIFEPSSAQFHPNGLYSESIFGQVGSPDRISKLGYISLHTDVIVPIIYRNLINVVSWYENILKGTQYAVFDPDQGEFIPADRDTELADTGFLYFMKHIPYFKFKRNKSITRTDEIGTIEEAISDDKYKTNKIIVCPAGWRDVRIDQSGHVETEDVNKLYSSLIALSNELSIPLNSPAIISFFNNIRLSIQLKVNEIFQYFKNFSEGKSGFNQEKYAKRYVAWGTRNVITTPTLKSSSPDAIDYLKHDETLQPLFQLAIAFMPLVIHHLNSIFVSQIYSFGSIQVPAIDKETYEVKYVEVSPSDVTEALSSESKAKFIQDFKNLELRQNPVTVKDINGNEYYLWLVYDLGDSIYIFRNIDDLEKLLNDKNIIDDGDTILNIEDCPELTYEDAMPRFYNVLQKFKEYLGINLSHMQLKLSKMPYNKDGTISKEFDPYDSAGSHTNKGFIVINPDIKTVMKKYEKIDKISLNNFWKFVEFVMAHELVHELLDNHKDAEVVQKLSKEAIDTGYTTAYTESIEKDKYPDKYKQEVICEYIAGKINDSKLSKYKIDKNKIHPLTNVEMLYIATHKAASGKYTTICRYPAIEMGSTFPTKPVVASTSPSRVVRLKSQYNPNEEIVYPHYPVYGLNTYLDSTVIHPCKTAGLNADHDGDTTSSNGIYTNEAIEECESHLNSLRYYVSPSGKFYDTADTQEAKLALHALTFADDEELKKIIPE